jgi:uncharacterized protein (DUF1684 family)
MGRRRLALVIAVVILGNLWSGAADKVDPTYQQSFDKWKAELVDDLKQNWLTLAGLFWLKPGENTFGSDKSNAVVFPSGPAYAGSFVLQNDEVTVKFLPGADARMAGKPVKLAKLPPDSSGTQAVVEMGGLRMRVIKRGSRMGIRLKDVDNPAVRTYRGPVFYPIQLSYRVTAKWIASDGKKFVDVPNVLGDVTPTPISGEARFKLNGHEFQLTDLGGDPEKSLFFVFNDLTSKSETYPGGRFLETDPVKNGTVVLDFNKAYNPPCAVTPFATCPLAPKENRLAIAIPAGEKYHHLHGHH